MLETRKERRERSNKEGRKAVKIMVALVAIFMGLVIPSIVWHGYAAGVAIILGGLGLYATLCVTLEWDNIKKSRSLFKEYRKAQDEEEAKLKQQFEEWNNARNS